MKRQELLNLRLQTQGLNAGEFRTPSELVGRMGAIQAQNFSMSTWGVGIRLPGSTNGAINAALVEGQILRSHILRPTWHLVRAEDLLWMQRLTAPNVKRLLDSSSKTLGLTTKDLRKAERLIQKMLEETEAAALTRETLLTGLQARKMPVDGQRGAYFLMQAELSALICSGASLTGESTSTYALTEKRLGSRWEGAFALANGLSKEEALARLARLYFQSRGPASLQDFKWWSGLSLTDARLGVMGIGAELDIIKAEVTYYYLNSAVSSTKTLSTCWFLPAFDEYLISYQDRTAVIDTVHHPKAFTKNGIFSPVLLYKGQAIATWEKKVAKNGLLVTVYPFDSIDKRLHPQIAKALKDYGHFMEMPINDFSIKDR